MLERISQDLRYAVRTLRRAPGFAAAAALTLALGIGATTAMFSVVDAVVLNPFAFRAVDRLSYPDFLDVARGARSFTGVAAWREAGFILTGRGEPRALTGQMISAGYLAVLVAQRTREIGVRMALGARRGQMVRQTIVNGQWLTVRGIVIGALGALAGTRALGGLLYGVTATDPPTFGGVALILAAVAALACLLPARRAAHVDPVVALRAE